MTLYYLAEADEDYEEVVTPLTQNHDHDNRGFIMINYIKKIISNSI